VIQNNKTIWVSVLGSKIVMFVQVVQDVDGVWWEESVYPTEVRSTRYVIKKCVELDYSLKTSVHVSLLKYSVRLMSMWLKMWKEWLDLSSLIRSIESTQSTLILLLSTLLFCWELSTKIMIKSGKTFNTTN